MRDFFSLQLAEHFGRGLQGGELAIGVEDVELAVVLAKRGAGVGAAGVVDGLGRSLAFADDQGLEDAEQLVAIGGEVLQDVDRAALVAEDGDQIDGGHLRAEEFLCGGERAQLVGRAHGGHVEVKRKQAAILVATAFRGFGRDLSAGEVLVDFDLFRAGRGGDGTGASSAARSWCSQKLIVCGAPSSVTVKSLAVSPGNEFALLVFDHDRFDHQLRLGGEGVGSRASWRTCSGRSAAQLPQQRRGLREEAGFSSQNLRRSEVSRLRIGLGASGRPNCVLFTVVFQPVNTG